MIVNSVWAAAPVVAMGLSFAAGLALATQLGRVSHGPWHAQRLGLARALRRSARAWVLARCRVPAVLLADALADAASVDADGFALVDLRLVGARLIGVEPAASNGPPAKPRGLAALVERVVGEAALDLGGRIILPRFVDAHAHPLKSNLIARTPNPTHSPNGALTCEVRDHAHWLGTAERAANALARRLDFALGCALHHGTKAMRAHLDGLQDLEPELGALVWAEFDGARARWLSRGLELQGVANLYLPAYAPADARAQARTRAHVAAAACRAGAVLGAYCPFEQTEPALLALWLDALFAHAQAQPRAPPTGAAMAAGAAPAERELDVDLHIDEHADPSYASLALPALCAALERARARGYGGHVLLGHCTALCLRLPGASASDDRARQELIERMATLGPALTVVANPLTNCALQDRQGTATPVKAVEPRLGPRTPVWRGLTALQELRAAGVRVAAASDNVRDWCARGGDARAGGRAGAGEPSRVRARAVAAGARPQVVRVRRLRHARGDEPVSPPRAP